MTNIGSTAPLSAQPKSMPAKPRIVAVDDQRDSLRLLQLRLQSAGFDCICFSEGPAAIDFLAGEGADVVILDVMMPHMDGYEICQRLKELPQTRDIPVLFLTAKMETEDKVRGLEVGGHDYLSKPVEQQELLARTRAALRVKQLQDQLKEQLALQQKINQLHQGMLSEHWQKTLGQLAASLAHEINNPLAVALGCVQLLVLEEAFPEDIQSRLQMVDQSLQRAGKKLRSLLLIAQSSRKPQRIQLMPFIEDILTLINFQVVMNKIGISTDLSMSGSVKAIPGELARAVLYIINNAVEATSGQADPRICLKIQAQDEFYAVRILDNGPGVPEAIGKQIFEPFFTTKGEPHYGIGLYLANSIIQAAGGRIELHCPSLEGMTEFRLLIPAG